MAQAITRRYLLARFWAPAIAGHPHAGERHMGIATLVTWLLTVGIGAYMLRTWIARGGPRMQRAGADRLPPVVVYGHASLAVTGLAIWISYLATSLAALAWSAACLLMPVIGLGAAMVTVWTPYPVPPTGGTGCRRGCRHRRGTHHSCRGRNGGRLTDEVLARALTDDALAAGWPTRYSPRCRPALQNQCVSTATTWRLSSRPATEWRP